MSMRNSLPPAITTRIRKKFVAEQQNAYAASGYFNGHDRTKWRAASGANDPGRFESDLQAFSIYYNEIKEKGPIFTEPLKRNKFVSKYLLINR